MTMEQKTKMERKCGILLALSSLPGPFGIGTMGKQAYTFIDQLKEAGQSFWQILPLSPSGAGNSPYQSISAFAGNPDFIDFDLLAEDGLMTQAEADQCRAPFIQDAEYAEFDTLRQTKLSALYPAYLRAKEKYKRQMQDFAWENSHWIHDYALYAAFSERFGSCALSSWPQPLRDREAAALMQAACQERERIGFHIFCQFIFWRQWDALKCYANENGIEIIGDMPFYVAGDSADLWANRACFDKEGLTAGCPPDYFAPEGQLWGNPVYDWEAMRADGYSWWMRRIAFQLAHFDVLRIDHFRGFEAYYAIPAGAQTAAQGHWAEGPGDSFMEMLKTRFPIERFIAEDLGSLTGSFFEFMQRHGLPGLKVLQFAFTPGENSIYLPHRHTPCAVVYTGTHDNDTTLGWYKSACEEVRAFARAYLGSLTEKNAAHTLIRTAYMSVAQLAIIPMQDVLGLDSGARMNTPSTVGGTNWAWRLKDGQFDEKNRRRLYAMAKLYGRI